MGFSKQLTEGLKMKLIDTYKAEEGCKKISKCFQLAVSTVRNDVKKWLLKRAVEVNARSGRPIQLIGRTGHMLDRKAKQKKTFRKV